MTRPSRRYLILALLSLSCLLGQLRGEEHAEKHPWWDAKWPNRKKLVIDTGAQGVAIGAPIGSAAVLLRLHDGNFNFLGSREDGGDLRFVTDDNKTVLPHHVEKWDGLLNEAYVWVKAPEVKSSGITTLWMYSGNLTDAAPAEDAKATFDEDTVAVFHFGSSASLGKDASASALALQGVGAAGPGSIGGGHRLTSQAALTLQAAAPLAWTEGGSFSFSAWFKPTATVEGVLFQRKEGTKSLTIGFSTGVPYLEISGQRASAGQPAAPGVWQHLTVSVSGGNANFYVNGKKAATLAAGLPALAGDMFFGADSTGAKGVLGDLDEVRLSKNARSEAWSMFEAASQGISAEAGKLISLGQDELSEHEEEGELMKHVSLLVDISKDLTVDGWVVIVCCTVLAIVGMGIALNKFLYLNTIEKATAEFLKRWEKISSDLTAIDSEDDKSIQNMGGTLSAKTLRMMKQSPLYHIYHLGVVEISRRVTVSQGDARSKETKGLSGRSIQAVKATMHSGLVREVQKLNSNLVFLTIGIAGGPYLGLLGTVIGVMITFAVIAKSGQVEVNSIAPGIAGALLATVAGLAVAIPCLFIYSYLSARIKNVVTNMETFIDEFITKMAEHHKEV
jgi:biopolymer transport protein ExbB